MTPPEHVPLATRRRTELFTAPYWGEAVSDSAPEG
jgi:hypothetical protein